MLLVALLPVPGSANEQFVDEQWYEPWSPDKGYHSLTIRENITPMAPMWRAENWERTGLKWRMCNSLSQSWCKNPDRYKFEAHYPACDETNTKDCIVSLRITKPDGTVLDAAFERYVFEDHPNAYKGNGKEVFRNVSVPSIWTTTDSSGTKKQYLITAGLSGYYGDGSFIRGNFSQVIPVELIPTVFQDPTFPFDIPIPQCDDQGCSGSSDYEGTRCTVYTSDGFCAKTKSFGEGDRIELSLSMTLQPNGWFHGRIQDPELSIAKKGNQTVVTVSAAPVRVPVLHVSSSYDNLPANLKRYFDRCVREGFCPYSSQSYEVAMNPKSKGSDKNVQVFYWPNSKEAVDAVGIFAKFANDRALASPAIWKVETLDFRTRDYPSGCFKTNDGLQGIVTTNSIAYLDGPPKLQGGYLNYQVAGLHTDRSRNVVQGSYDLVLRSDVARCLYRFSKAPVSATITVTGDGDRSIATTVVGEKNGWLKLSAYGFTFSKKTIKVKLTQKRTTINCVSETDPTQTRKVTAIGPKCPTGFKQG